MIDETKAIILFEHPLNERCRTLLRLSRLFAHFDRHIGRESPWSSKTALQALLEIAAVLARPDIKSEFIKELERQGAMLTTLVGHPDADEIKLQQTLEDVRVLSEQLKSDSKQLGQGLRKNAFLSSAAQRLAVPGGSFDFDLPQLHYWLHLPREERLMQLDGWREEIILVQNAVDLLLTLIRESSRSQNLVAERGFYQQNLDAKKSIQMVRIGVNPILNVFPEVVGSKHRFCVRFMDTVNWEHPEQSNDNIPFQINICII